MADILNSTNSGLTLNVKKTLEFFDEKPQSSYHHATALVSLFGEDLAIELLRDYCERKNYKFEFIDRVCTTGKKEGRRLDGWLSIEFEKEKIYFQTEIKNWSAHAIGGKILPIDADEKTLQEHRKRNFLKQFGSDNKITSGGVSKVLIPMKQPQGVGNYSVMPLVCYWFVIHPEGKETPFFTCDLNREQIFSDLYADRERFKKVHIFSMSEYLRLLHKQGVESVNFNAGRTIARLGWIDEILRK